MVPAKLREKVINFRRRKGVTCLHCSLAGHRGQDIFKERALSLFTFRNTELLQNIKKELAGGKMAPKGRYCRDDIGVAPEFPHGETHFVKFGTVLLTIRYQT